MALKQRLDLRQSQTLVMTPQLQQAIKLLQLSNLDLTAYVEQELERNPLLRPEEGAVDGVDGDEDQMSGEAVAGDTQDLAAGDGIARENEALLDTDYDNMWNGEAGSAAPGLGMAATSRGGAPAEGRSLEQTISDEVSLREHLLAQIDMDLDDPVDRAIAAALVDLLDDSGYMTRDPAEIAASLGCGPARVEAVLQRLKAMDPDGIFARDLAECLALQLRERNRLDPAIQALLDNLDLVARRELEALRRICGVDDDDLRDMIEEIRSLDPKPAQAFDAAVAQPIRPDVLMRRRADGGWLVELNSETLPRVLVDNQYYARVSGSARKRADRDYLAEQLQSANWLVRAMHQRATTILRVASEIVRQQEGFFAHGVEHLRPLVLRDIAEALEMHESTVSRVTSNKYILTSRGVFELKYFFSAAIAGTAGGSHSAEAVRHRVKALIHAEDHGAVLSDDAVVAMLRTEGIDIARRTVAKYREAMRIPSSVQRRREKAVSI